METIRYSAWTRTADLDRVLSGETPVRFLAHTPDDILTALRLAEEIGLRVVVEGASGAHRVAGDLHEAGVPVVAWPAIGTSTTLTSAEAYAQSADSVARLHAQGVLLALSTHGIGRRAVTVEAVAALGNGLPSTAALNAITLGAARILGIDDRIGSIEPGKDADLVLWRGDPLGTWGEAQMVLVEGEVVYRRSAE